MSYVLVGGTFDGLHKGHVKLLEKTFSIGGHVLVCITSDKMVRSKRASWKISSFSERKRGVEALLRKKGWLSKSEIVKIDNPFSEGLRPDLTHVVVSPETRPNAEKINEMRSANCLGPLEIVEIGWELSEDGKPVSDARIRAGEIDRDGHLLHR